MKQPLVAHWGGGRNSTAMLVGFEDFGHRPDAILFADTGGEKPETYAYIETMNLWLARAGFPSITIVRNDGVHRTLENECMTQGTLPSLAYGWKKCSDKYKRRPQDKWLRCWAMAIEAWKLGMNVVKAIGYDAGEERRVLQAEKHHAKDKGMEYWYPVYEWGWDLETCIDAIECAGLPAPPKSACFFCPASRKPEIIQLRASHPKLFERAVAMERKAAPNNTACKGLGRRFSWEAFIKATEEDQRRMHETVEEPCGCFDGDYDD